MKILLAPFMAALTLIATLAHVLGLSNPVGALVITVVKMLS